MNIFEGLKVLELTTTIAAPSVGMMLGDWGADVIKVEPPTGDSWRHFRGTAFNYVFSDDDNPVYELYNSQKRNICLNLKTEEGMKVFHKLLSQADVFICNNRKSACVKMGIDYDTLHKLYPSMIYASLSGYGDFGPEAENPGYDTASFWARSGLSADLTPKGANPVLIAAGIGDTTSGMGLFFEVCAALFHRGRTGEGLYVSNSLYGAGMWAGSMMITMTEPAYGNKWPKPRFLGNPVNANYWTKDGEMVNITIVDWNRYAPEMCKAMGHPEIIEKYPSYKAFMDNREEVFPLMEAMFKEFDSKDAVKILSELGITCNLQRHWHEQWSDYQAYINGYIEPMQFSTGLKFIRINPPMYFKHNPREGKRNSESTGQSTVKILKQLGYSDAEIQGMLDSKAAIQR